MTAAPTTTADRPALGVALMFGFCALAPLGDGLAKVLGQTIPLLQLIFVRFAIQCLLLAPLSRRAPPAPRRILGMIFLRTVLHIVGVGAMFASLQFLPLADAVAIAFVMPFIMLLLGKFVLEEAVGPRRLAACVVGFIGTLLVVQPSFAAVGAPALLPLLVAFIFAGFMLVTRKIAKEVDPIRLQTVSGWMATGLLAPLLVVGMAIGSGPLAPVAPTMTEVALLLTIGVVGTTAHLLMTWSLRYAPSATLAPMQYLEIPFATLIGWLIFRDLPNGLAAIGILITCAAGLYIIARERAAAKVG